MKISHHDEKTSHVFFVPRRETSPELELELELELIQTHMTQKPLLWVEVGAHWARNVRAWWGDEGRRLLTFRLLPAFSRRNCHLDCLHGKIPKDWRSHAGAKPRKEKTNRPQYIARMAIVAVVLAVVSQTRKESAL
jgi:hypothetical protein